jgi:Flp pilus assembly pilin Flp
MLGRFWKDERGLETAEWALLLGLVVLAGTIAALGARDSISSIFQEMRSELATAETIPGAGT